MPTPVISRTVTDQTASIKPKGSLAPREARLFSAIQSAQEELLSTKGNGEWKARASSLLKDAAESATKDIDYGWKQVALARRLRFQGQEPRQLMQVMEDLDTEANQKLTGWRKTAVNRALQAAQKALADKQFDVLREVVTHASEIVDGHNDNEYHKARLQRRFIYVMLAVMLLGIAAIFMFAAFTKAFPKEGALSGGPVVALGLAACLGFLGAAFSALLSRIANGGSTRIPEQLADIYVAVSRCVLGSVAGIAAYVLVNADIIPLDKTAIWAVMATCFSAGFSERLVVSALEKTG